MAQCSHACELHAVHIDTTNSMTTDSFILALRRLISRRGNIRIIQTNNGRNIVGASTELKRAFSEMGKKINDFLMNLGGEWLIWRHNNTPTTSNMGGVRK